MAIRRNIIRAAVTAGVTGVLVLLGTGVASAHVTVTSPDQPVAGGDALIVVRAPDEDDTASVDKVELDLPRDTPLSNASPEPVPGWNVQVNMVNLKTPVKMANDTVTEAVSSIVWTAQPGQGTPANDFQEFSFWAEDLPTNTSKLVFTAVQTYGNGRVVTWNQPTQPGGQEPDNPAPQLAYVSSAGSDSMAGMSGSDSVARWLGGAGIVVAAVALGFGLGAWTRSRRPGPAGKTRPAAGGEEAKG
ncbi:MAG TPA: YcnI family protein [Pseudonocardiaceae bacterium]